MRRVLALAVLALAALPSPFVMAADTLELQIVMTRGESSRDSHSQRITIKVSGNKLTYTKTYTGRLKDRAPIAIDFQLTDYDVQQIVDGIKNGKMLVTETIERQGGPKGAYLWFDLRIRSTLNESTGLINIRGPRKDSNIPEEQLYKDAVAFIKSVFGIVHRLNPSINYESLIP